jgi:hypothetical protein
MPTSNARSVSAPATVALVIRITSGAPEDLTRPELRKGQVKWWIQRTDRRDGVPPYIDAGNHPGNAPAELTIEASPGGKYKVGTGHHTRIAFECPSVPCTLSLDPVSGTAKVVEGKPSLAVVETSEDEGTGRPSYHIRNAPIGSLARGQTYHEVRDAFADLGVMTDNGQVTSDDILSGRVAVTAGAWPAGSYAPPPPPVPVSVTLAVRTPDPVPEVRAHVADVRAVVAASAPIERSEPRVLPMLVRGLAPAPVVRSFGTTLGNERRGIKQEPHTLAVVGAVADTVRCERREDHTVPMDRLWFNDDGTVGVRSIVADGPGVSLRDLATQDIGNVSLRLEPGALDDLVSMHRDTMPRGKAIMHVLDPEIRAAVWNAQNRDHGGEVVLRTRRTVDAYTERHQAYAVVSPGYTACDADVIADVVAGALGRIPGGDQARGGAEYDPRTTRLSIDAVWPEECKVGKKVGDTVKMGVRITSADNGTGAINIRLLTYRLVCLNGMVGSRDEHVARVIHRGSREAMIKQLVKGIEHVNRAASAHVARLATLRDTDVRTLLVDPGPSVEMNMRSVFTAMAGVVDPLPQISALVPDALPPGVTFEAIERDVLVESLLSAWHHEPGDSLADVVNAVTRLHSERVPVPVVRQAEHVAGMLVDAWA